jgi:tRNA-dihydrouridine synthase 1
MSAEGKPYNSAPFTPARSSPSSPSSPLAFDTGSRGFCSGVPFYCEGVENADTNEPCQRPSVQVDATALSRETDLWERMDKVRDNDQAISGYVEIAEEMKM